MSNVATTGVRYFEAPGIEFIVEDVPAFSLHDAMLVNLGHTLNPAQQFFSVGKLEIGRIFHHELDAGGFVVQLAGSEVFVVGRAQRRGTVHAESGGFRRRGGRRWWLRRRAQGPAGRSAAGSGLLC